MSFVTFIFFIYHFKEPSFSQVYNSRDYGLYDRNITWLKEGILIDSKIIYHR